MLFCLKRISLWKSIANTQMADQFMLDYEGLRMAMRFIWKLFNITCPSQKFTSVDFINFIDIITRPRMTIFVRGNIKYNL